MNRKNFVESDPLIFKKRCRWAAFFLFNRIFIKMNLLAHIHLSGNSEEIMIGNFIGDFIKGKNFEPYSNGFKTGILLHRHIDFFTDTHEVVSASKSILYPRYHKYAGVMVDIFYDHFLARNWEKYHPEPLEKFAADFYASISRWEKILPLQVRQFLPYMVKNNWLVNYRKLEGIQRSLSGMSRRAKFISGMENGVEDMKLHYDEFNAHFNSFYPELLASVQKELSKTD